MGRVVQLVAESVSGTAPTRERVSLGIGAVVLARQPSVVRTVLGSCVAAILHVPSMKVSALCHAQLPENLGDGCCDESCPSPCSIHVATANAHRYVTCAIRHMVRELRRLRVASKDIVATLVGGANVLENLAPRWSVANRNVEVARATLDEHRIRLSYIDTGGIRGRVIEHFSDLNLTRVRYHGRER